MPEDSVSDDELLYRRVPRNNGQLYYRRDGCKVLVLGQAFSERAIPDGQPHEKQYRISVDRAKLRGFDPDLTRQAAPGGDTEHFAVITMPAGEVRRVPDVDDVIPDPIKDDLELRDNEAHALICIRYEPETSKSRNKNIFREVIAELADIANRQGWAIEPNDAPEPA